MNKKLILVLGIIFLLVITGCKSGNKDKNPITDVDVRKGIDGLAMTFIMNAPPASVFENSIFPIGVELKNKGASNIENGLLVFGFEKTYVDVSEANKETQKFDIKGKSIFNLNGDEELIKINAKAKMAGTQSEIHPSTILATACYPYQTIFGTSVCVDTDIYGERKTQKACSIKDSEFNEGQGAPVAITKVDARMLYTDENKVRPQFIIYIENKGNGEVIDSNKSVDACGSKKLEYTDFNTLKIIASLSGKDLDCGVDENNLVRLKEKKDAVRCVSKDEDTISRNIDAYTAPLEVTLSYGYTFTIPKDIVIEKT